MLRLSRDRLLISLAPDAVALARVAGTPRPRLASKQEIECDPASGSEPWQGAVAALATAIEPLRSERLDVTVVLSNHFVRYAIVPFDAAVAGREEELAFARFYFTKIHGERARNWEVRLSDGPRGSPRPASAVDAALVQAVRECFPGDDKARLVSVQPYLMSAFNLWRAAMAKEDAWLLLIEPQRACLALVSGGVWATAQTSHGKFPVAEDWSLLLDRQQLRTDAATVSHTVLVHAPESLKSVTVETSGWKFLGITPPPLDGYLPLEDSHLAMALTAR